MQFAVNPAVMCCTSHLHTESLVLAACPDAVCPVVAGSATASASSLEDALLIAAARSVVGADLAVAILGATAFDMPAAALFCDFVFCKVAFAAVALVANAQTRPAAKYAYLQ